MPSRLPTAGSLPASFSNTALLTIAIMSAMEHLLDLRDELRAEHRIDHLHVRRIAAQVGLEVIVPARLRRDAGLLAVVQDRAEPLLVDARHVEPGVDDDA